MAEHGTERYEKRRSIEARYIPVRMKAEKYMQIWLACFLIHVATSAAVMYDRGWDMYGALNRAVTFVLLLFFSQKINSGIRKAVYLPLLCGMIILTGAAIDLIYFGKYYAMLTNIDLIAKLLVGMVQTVIFIKLLFDKQFKKYARELVKLKWASRPVELRVNTRAFDNYKSDRYE